MLQRMGAELEKKGQLSLLNSPSKKQFVEDAKQTLKIGAFLFKDTLLPQSNFLYRYLIINSISLETAQQFREFCARLRTEKDFITDTPQYPLHLLCKAFLAVEAKLSNFDHASMDFTLSA